MFYLGARHLLRLNGAVNAQGRDATGTTGCMPPEIGVSGSLQERTPDILPSWYRAMNPSGGCNLGEGMLFGVWWQWRGAHAAPQGRPRGGPPEVGKPPRIMESGALWSVHKRQIPRVSMTSDHSQSHMVLRRGAHYSHNRVIGIGRDGYKRRRDGGARAHGAPAAVWARKNRESPMPRRCMYVYN